MRRDCDADDLVFVNYSRTRDSEVFVSSLPLCCVSQFGLASSVG